MLPAFCDWYEITARERQIIAYLQSGAAPKQIARLLGLSVHTVNQHLRAVFHKTGSCGRDAASSSARMPGEVCADRLFCEEADRVVRRGCRG
nr:helix-turn-helix transcriptional regulator [Streptomyces sp. CBMA152]